MTPGISTILKIGYVCACVTLFYIDFVSSLQFANGNNMLESLRL